jgi:molybdenum cofactor biosynthesis protein B
LALHEDHHRVDPVSAGVALLTVSDSRDERQDRSGATARELLVSAGHRVIDYRVLPDEAELISDQIGEWLARQDCEVVIVNGGTGISPRDRTHEAVNELLEQRLDGFGELFRALSYEQIGSAAMLSRAVGGIAAGRPVFALPGSTAAVTLALEKLILPELAHLLTELRKEP